MDTKQSTPKSKTTHTPGPWKIGDHPFDIVRSTSEDEYRVVATAAHDMQGLNRGREERLANARLIAAAPDMAAWIAYVLEHGLVTWPSEVQRARALLARIGAAS